MSDPALRVTGLTKRFGGVTAVEDLNLVLRAREMVGLIGPNGAGKTTVFNLLTGVYRPDEGNVNLAGVDILGSKPDRITGLGIARTFQNIRLFPDLSVLDNVKVGCTVRNPCGILASLVRSRSFRESERRIEETAWGLLQMVQLSGKAALPARGLAYGEQRRLEMARALATRPRVLLLDEPAAGANETESGALRDLLLHLRETFDFSILLIEHDMPFVMGLVQRLVVLDHGTIIAEGKPEEIRKDERVIEAYLGRGD